MNDIGKARQMSAWLEEKNITDIELIEVSELSSELDYFLIGTAGSDRQARTAAEYLEEKCEEAGYPRLGKEGEESAKWILLDYADIVVHIFLQDERKYYNLEKLWVEGNFLNNRL